MDNASVLKILGLHTNNNEFSEVPIGSLADCNNVVLTKDSVLEPRRGFKLYGNAMGASATADVAKQLMVYKKRIIRHFTNTLEFDNGSGTFSAFNGTYSEVNPGQRMRALESNGNFYICTSDGVKKISVNSASKLSTNANFITNAGGIRALDLNGVLNETEGFLSQNSKVAYRLVWGIKDDNSNLILGAPSERCVITNPLILLLIKDFNNLLASLDDACAQSGGDELADADYVATYKIPANLGSSATSLYNNLLGLAAKLENDLNTVGAPTYTRKVIKAEITANLGRIVFDGAVPTWLSIGNTVKVEGLAAPYEALNGNQGISNITTDTIVNDTIEFPFTGTVTALGIASGTVRLHEFLAITQPTEPSVTPTTTELLALQDYYTAMVTLLLGEPPSKINDASIFSNNAAKTSSTVDLTFTIPEEITTAHFFQVYRTQVVYADGAVTLDEIDPGDEMGLIYEANPTTIQITNKEVTFTDITTDAFRGTNLYTNPQSGEGILQANESPPVALDIASFRGSTFYANTKTRYRLLMNLVGVSNFTSGVSNITFTDGTNTDTYIFVSPVAEITQIDTIADVAGSLNNTYFYVNSALDATEYYVWFNGSGTGTDPLIANKTGIEVAYTLNDTANDIATALRNKLNQYNDFIITGATNQVIITNADDGITTDASDVSTGFTIAVTTQGNGEDVSNNQILLSNAATPAQQVDATARSLIKVINRTSNGVVYASYLSGPDDVPGQLLIYSRQASDPNFYITSTDDNILQSFNPVLKKTFTISGNTAANPTVITTSTAHEFVDGDEVIIRDSDSVPVINGAHTITYISPTQFSINVNVTVAGTAGEVALSSTKGDNEDYANRIYYSKFQQPEAVPLVNFIDVGPRDSIIQRILPLRDGLFVFKDDGIYRISGESVSTGFSVVLFDNTTTIQAPDSAVVANNQIFYFSDQGITVVSDTGSQIVSRDIENNLLPMVNGTNFTSATFGLAYESDRAYHLFTINNIDDVHAEVCYRYNFSTNAWTKWEVSKTCGIINEDKMYLGAGDINFVEQERKDFIRQDYADREHVKTVSTNAVDGLNINIGSSNNVNVGDALVQVQYLTIYKFNQVLSKLDHDNNVSDNDYLSLLEAVPGDSLRNKLDALATKLDNDTGVADTDFLSSISTYTSSFPDTQEAFNVITDKLNNDPGLSFNNYPTSTGTVTFETIISAVNTVSNVITMILPLPIIEGDVTIYNSYNVSVKWNVQSFGDPELYKQVPEAKVVFQRTNFTGGTISFNSDISNAFEDINFTVYGNGTFGNDVFGEIVFGGNGDRRPMRVLVPRNKQRGRFLQMKMLHRKAREKMAILGYSMLFKSYSSKAYTK